MLIDSSSPLETKAIREIDLQKSMNLLGHMGGVFATELAKLLRSIWEEERVPYDWCDL